MRKRSESPPQQAEEKQEPVKGGDSRRYPIEEDLSAMQIALKAMGYQTKLTDVTGWESHVRHFVAMVVNGDMREEDLPEAVLRFKGAPQEAPKVPTAREVVESVQGGIDKIFENVKGAVAEASLKVIDGGKSDSARHDSTRRAAKGGSITAELVEGEMLLSPDTVTVSWGQEKFYPVAGSYNSFEVGILSTTVHLKPGEDRATAVRSAYADLAKLGEEFREQKRVSFLRALKGLREDPK